MTKRDLPENAILIPDIASKVFMGKIFDVYQWEQRLFDGSTTTYEMLRRPDTVLVIALDDDDQVIVMREQQSGLPPREVRVPGGKVNVDDESTLAAVQRELFEETGIRMKQWVFAEVVQPEIKLEWFIHVFVARGIASTGMAQTDAGEKIDLGRMSYEVLRQDNFDRRRVSIFEKITTTEQLKALFGE